LCLGIANAVASVSAEKILVLIALGLQHLGHAVVGLDPVVAFRGHGLGQKRLAIAGRAIKHDAALRHDSQRLEVSRVSQRELHDTL